MNEYFTKIMPQIRETCKYRMDASNKKCKNIYFYDEEYSL